MPSMPGAPLFWRTCFRARCRLARSRTWASNAGLRIDSGVPDNPATSSSCGVAAACVRRWSDALPSLFVMVLRLSSFGPSVGAAHLLCPRLTSPRYSASVSRCPASMFRSTGEISRGKTRYLRCIDAGFTKCTPTADGGLRGHVPARPGCITPHIRFLFIAPQLWIGLPPAPRLTTTPLPFSLPSALRKPGHRTFTYEVTRHARRTRRVTGAARLYRAASNE
jgi:hypothetical protein